MVTSLQKDWLPLKDHVVNCILIVGSSDCLPLQVTLVSRLSPELVLHVIEELVLGMAGT